MSVLRFALLLAVLVAVSACDSGDDAPIIGGQYVGVTSEGEEIVVTIPSGTESDSGEPFTFTYTSGASTTRVSPTYRYPRISWSILLAALACDVSADGNTLDCVVSTPGANEVETYEFTVTRAGA